MIISSEGLNLKLVKQLCCNCVCKRNYLSEPKRHTEKDTEKGRHDTEKDTERDTEKDTEQPQQAN